MTDKIYRDVAPVSGEDRAAILRKTAHSLPDSPSAAGMKPDQIRRHFWSAIVGERQSVLHEIDRVARETNAALGALWLLINGEVEVDGEKITLADFIKTGLLEGQSLRELLEGLADGSAMELISSGVPGYSMEQYLAMLKREIDRKAQKGDPGEAAGFGEVVAEAVSVGSDEAAEVSVITDGEDTAKNFYFRFAIPRGEQGKKGDTGERGPQGIQGIQGIQGPQGKPFAVAEIYTSEEEMHADVENDEIAVGDFVMITTDSVEQAENARIYVKTDTGYAFVTDMSGATGIQGPQGLQGIPGETPHIGENGNWWVGNIDTGVSASVAVTPEFDLVMLGLEAVPMDGTVVQLEMDTTDIREALGNGAIKVRASITDEGVVSYGTAILNNIYLSGGAHFCSCPLVAGTMQMTFNLVVWGDHIEASFTDLSSGGSGASITVDAALSEVSENPVQNKVIAKKVREMDTAASGLTTRVEALEKSGGGSGGTGGGGVSSWNDLTDKPFGDEKIHIAVDMSQVDTSISFEFKQTRFVKIVDKTLSKHSIIGATISATFPEGDTVSALVSETDIVSEYDGGLVLTILGQVPLWVCYKDGKQTGDFDGEPISIDVPEIGIYTAAFVVSELSSVEFFADNLKQLDNKYLSILDSEAGTETDIFAEQTLNFAYYSNIGAYAHSILQPVVVFEDGKEYDIVWDGVRYTRKAFAHLSPLNGAECISVGNTLAAGGESNGDVFAVVCDITNGYVQFLSLEQAETHTVRIYQSTPDTYKLKPRYLPIIEGEEGNETVVFDEQALTFEGDGGQYLSKITPPAFELTIGERYNVTWDGKVYTSVCAQPIDGIDIRVIGNKSLVSSDAENTGEPFAISYVALNEANTYNNFTSNDTKPTHVVRVTQGTLEAYKIKHEYPLEQPVSVDMSAFASEGKIVETFADGTSKTTVVELNGIGNPSKITDSDGNVIEFTW